MSRKQPTPPPATAEYTRWLNQVFFEKIFGTPEEREIERLGNQLYYDLPSKWQKYLIAFCKSHPGRLEQAVAVLADTRELNHLHWEYARERLKSEQEQQELAQRRGFDIRGQTFHI